MKTSKRPIVGLFQRDLAVIGAISSQQASDAESVYLILAAMVSETWMDCFVVITENSAWKLPAR